MAVDLMSDIRRGRAGRWRTIRGRITTSGTSGQVNTSLRRVVFASLSAVNASQDNSIRLNLNSATTADGTTGQTINYSAATSGGVYEVYAEGV